jgi:phosphate transport system permease protein
VLLFIGWGAFALSPIIENAFMHGDSRIWLTHDMGIKFDQRNSLVVGIAMGFAVIPTIFSIAEDAVFSVPKHLTQGSLALGRPVADPEPGGDPHREPGHLLGGDDGPWPRRGRDHDRADGHRQHPHHGLFHVPGAADPGGEHRGGDAGIGSGQLHYRVLFLAAFVLFVFTFLFNTLAEFVRQRLREKYSSL